MVKQIIVGLFVAGLGTTLIYFSNAVSDMFGRIEWFERNLGGTRNGYVVFGFGIIILGFLILFGVMPLSSPVTQDSVPVN